MTREKGLAVIAVGGNSLVVSEDRQAIPDQYEAAVHTVKQIVDVIASGWDVVITHGSGPQIGYILRRSELAIEEISPVPMDYAGADIQGALGYMFQRALFNEFTMRDMDRRAIAIVTQVRVDVSDKAFNNPAKPIGPYLDESVAKNRAAEMGWSVREDAGGGWRRVVPSPKPQEIVELEQIKFLSDAGYVVIACGGGGIPVLQNEKNRLVGIEAVIDKDLASAMLATDLKADRFVISTDVDQVALDFNTSGERWLSQVSLDEAKRYHDENQFDPGSMGPKVRAMINYLENGGSVGIVTSPDNLQRALLGKAGTRFVVDQD